MRQECLVDYILGASWPDFYACVASCRDLATWRQAFSICGVG